VQNKKMFSLKKSMDENLISNNGFKNNIWEGETNFGGLPEILIEIFRKI
jgi:hypothetical protein